MGAHQDDSRMRYSNAVKGQHIVVVDTGLLAVEYQA